MKYSISEEHHKKGFYIVELDGQGDITIEKRELKPLREMRTVEAKLDELLRHEICADYVFVRLLDENPVLQPMEKIRTVYPNAMHVERVLHKQGKTDTGEAAASRHQMDDMSLLKAFYREMRGNELSDMKQQIFLEVLDEVREREGGRR
jgi:exonuclease SbcD